MDVVENIYSLVVVGTRALDHPSRGLVTILTALFQTNTMECLGTNDRSNRL